MAQQASRKSMLSYATLLVLPVFSFLAYQAMLVPLFTLLADPKIKNASPSPPEWNYTGYEGIDKTLTLLVNFFLQSFEGGRFALMPEFIAFIGPVAIAPIIEMRRAGYRATTVFVSMLLIGYLYQTIGAGVILPFWWALHLGLAGHNTVPIPADYSEATLVGFFTGYVAISFAMVAYQTPGIIAIWQFFPAYILIAQALSLGSQRFLFRGLFSTSSEAFQSMYIFNIISSAATHAFTLFRIFQSSSPVDSLKDTYIPSYSLVSHAFVAFCQEFCKWDYIYITAATLFAGLWLLRGTALKLYAFGVFLISSVLLGPGAGISLVWILKENQLASLTSKPGLPQEKKRK